MNNSKDPQDMWHPPGKPWRDCQLYEPGTMSMRQQCKGLRQLYCAKEGKCGFYKPKIGRKETAGNAKDHRKSNPANN